MAKRRKRIKFLIFCQYFSPYLLESDFTNSLKRIKNKYNIPNNFITLEITESIGNIDRSIIATISKRIKDLGFNISLDDFGAKYANMSLLSTLNFDELKLINQ